MVKSEVLVTTRMVVWGKAMDEKLGWVNISGAPRKNMALVELMCI